MDYGAYSKKGVGVTPLKAMQKKPAQPMKKSMGKAQGALAKGDAGQKSMVEKRWMK